MERRVAIPHRRAAGIPYSRDPRAGLDVVPENVRVEMTAPSLVSPDAKRHPQARRHRA